MTQSHGQSLWREPAGSGGVPVMSEVIIVADGADYKFATSGTEAAILVDDGASGAQFSTTLTLPEVRRLVQINGDLVLY